MYNPNEISVSIDEVGIIPINTFVVSDEDVDISIQIGNDMLRTPIIGAAMDSVSSSAVLTTLNYFGTFGIVNLCGLISRYNLHEYGDIYKKLLASPTVATLQDVYNAKSIDRSLMIENIKLLHGMGVIFSVAATPQSAEYLFEPLLNNEKIRNFVIQSSFIVPEWKSKKYGNGLDIFKYKDLVHSCNKNIWVGNVASVESAKPFIDGGVDAIISGVGPGQQCSTRFVLGIGSGHATCVAEIRKYIEQSGSVTKLIADGGIHDSGDVIKLYCLGAHAVIVGGMLAFTVDAPFVGLHWGMSAMHHTLPRGMMLTREVKDSDTVRRVFSGPSNAHDGRFAFISAIKNALSNLGCVNLQQAYTNTKVVQFKGIKTEGKYK